MGKIASLMRGLERGTRSYPQLAIQMQQQEQQRQQQQYVMDRNEKQDKQAERALGLRGLETYVETLNSQAEQNEKQIQALIPGGTNNRPAIESLERRNAEIRAATAEIMEQWMSQSGVVTGPAPRSLEGVAAGGVDMSGVGGVSTVALSGMEAADLEIARAAAEDWTEWTDIGTTGRQKRENKITGEPQERTIPDYVNPNRRPDLNTIKQSLLKQSEQLNPDEMNARYESDALSLGYTLTDKERAAFAVDSAATAMHIGLSGPESNRLRDIGMIADAAREVVQLLRGDPKIAEAVGRVAGPGTRMIDWATGGAATEPELRTLQIALKHLWELYGRDRTGAAISITEEQRFDSIVGTIDMDDDAIATRMNALIGYSNSLVANTYGAKLMGKNVFDPAKRDEYLSQLPYRETMDYMGREKRAAMMAYDQQLQAGMELPPEQWEEYQSLVQQYKAIQGTPYSPVYAQ